MVRLFIESATFSATWHNRFESLPDIVYIDKLLNKKSKFLLLLGIAVK